MDLGTGAIERRRFLQAAGVAAASLAVPASVFAQGAAKEKIGADAIELPSLDADSEVQKPPHELPWEDDKRVRYAVVGLGHLTVEQLLPAFAQSKKSKLAALVSGSPEKARTIAERHGIPSDAIYGYDDYAKLAANKAIDAVYIVLPNSLHAEHTIKAARAGKHVLCEKPMATTVADAERMIAACKDAQRLLMIAYRIQYEPNNRLIQSFVRRKTYGDVRLIEMTNGQRIGDPAQWRLKRALAGGGALPDVGIYCLNTTRFLLGEEPVEVFARLSQNANDARFREVEDGIAFQMRFPSGVLSNHLSGYDMHECRRYRIQATKAWFGMEPAFPYEGQRIEMATLQDGRDTPAQPKVAAKNQFALEIDHFSDCIRANRTPYTPGEEGLQDMRIVEALYRSARDGKPVALPASKTLDAFRGPPPA